MINKQTTKGAKKMSHRKKQITKSLGLLKDQMASIQHERDSLIYNLENQARLDELSNRIILLDVAIVELEKLVA